VARRSKKEKAAGREQHRQMKKAKKLQKKQKKNISLPARHRKGSR
jgi:hypothetical protein